MSDWFFMLGEPLAPGEAAKVTGYLRGLGLDALPLETLADWSAVGAVIKSASWDQSWWEAEQREAKRLHERATQARGEGEVARRLSAVLVSSMVSLHGAAAVHATRAGYGDAGLIRAAAGAAGQALHFAELAELGGESAVHPFLLKRALFAGGHWPLGIVNGSYYLF